MLVQQFASLFNLFRSSSFGKPTANKLIRIVEAAKLVVWNETTPSTSCKSQWLFLTNTPASLPPNPHERNNRSHKGGQEEPLDDAKGTNLKSPTGFQGLIGFLKWTQRESQIEQFIVGWPHHERQAPDLNDSKSLQKCPRPAQSPTIFNQIEEPSAGSKALWWSRRRSGSRPRRHWHSPPQGLRKRGGIAVLRGAINLKVALK